MMTFQEKMKYARSMYGLSASAMSFVCGLGVNQWRIYENGDSIPDGVQWKIVNMCLDPYQFVNLLILDIEKNKEHFGSEKYYKCMKKAQEVCDEIQYYTEARRSKLIEELYIQQDTANAEFVL